MSETAEALLRHVGSWPAIRIDRNDGRTMLLAGAGASIIGALDVRAGALVVDVPWDMAGALRDHPRLPSPLDGAVHLDLLDDHNHGAAVEVLRWRTDIARFGWQLRSASP